MPLGSSSAAPVIRPGPSAVNGLKRRRCGGAADAGVTDSSTTRLSEPSDGGRCCRVAASTYLMNMKDSQRENGTCQSAGRPAATPHASVRTARMSSVVTLSQRTSSVMPGLSDL